MSTLAMKVFSSTARRCVRIVGRKNQGTQIDRFKMLTDPSYTTTRRSSSPFSPSKNAVSDSTMPGEMCPLFHTFVSFSITLALIAALLMSRWAGALKMHLQTIPDYILVEVWPAPMKRPRTTFPPPPCRFGGS